MQQEEHAQQNEYDRTHRNSAGLDRCPAAKCCRQTVRIGSGQTGLYGARRAHRIDNLVNVEEADGDAADNAQSFAVPAVASANPSNQHTKDPQMRQSLGVLPGVNRAHAEGEKSSKNSGHRRVGAAASRLRWWRRHRPRRRGKRSGNKSRRPRRNAFHLRSQAVLAIDHAPHRTCTVRAQCLPASAAIGHCRRIGMIGAVHTNLRFIFAVNAAVTAAGETSLSAAKTGWLYSWE